MFPAWIRDDGLGTEKVGETLCTPNLSPTASSYLNGLDANLDDLFHHALAVLHDPSYREANAGALRMEWPRIPLPDWPDGGEKGAADELAASAARGTTACRAAGLGHAGSRCHRGCAATGTGKHSSAVHHRRRKYGERRLRAHCGMGSLRTGRGRHAGPGPCRRAAVHGGRERHL